MMLRKIKNRNYRRQETPVGEIPSEEDESDLSLEDGNQSAQLFKRARYRSISLGGQEVPSVGKFGIVDPVKLEQKKIIAKKYANQVGNFFRRAIGQPEKLPPVAVYDANRRARPIQE